MLVRQFVPNVQVDGGRQSGAWLVEARSVVHFGNFLETGAFVREWANPLQTVQSARRQGLIQFAAWDVLNGCAQFAQNLAAEARHTEFQAVEVRRGADFLAEPTTGLGTGVTSKEGFQVEDLAQFVVQIMAATVVVPVCQLLRGAAEWYGSIVSIGRVLADIVVVGRVVHVGLTGGYRVKHFECANQFARCFLVDGQSAVRHLVNHVVQICGRIVQHGKTAWPRCYHCQGALALCIRRCCQRCGCGGCPAKCRCLQK